MMPLSNEKIAELQTLAEVLGVSPPSSGRINDLYDKHLARLTAPSVPDDPVAEREQERLVIQQREKYKLSRR